MKSMKQLSEADQTQRVETVTSARIWSSIPSLTAAADFHGISMILVSEVSVSYRAPSWRPNVFFEPVDENSMTSSENFIGKLSCL